MVQACLAVLAMIALVAMSLRANRRFEDEVRLPMQWSFDGSVNWTAPRHVALAFTPALATAINLATVVATLVLTPRAGQEGFEFPITLILAATFIAVHALHLWLIEKSLRSKG